MGSTVTAPQLQREAQRAERAEKVWQLKRGGASYPEIVRQLKKQGYHRVSLATVHRDFHAQLHAHQVAPEEVQHWRELHVTRLEHMLAHAINLVTTAGKDADRVQALNTGVRILERQAKLLGLDAPVKIDAEVTIRDQSPDELANLLGSILDQPTPALN